MELIQVAIIEDDLTIQSSLVQSVNMYPAMNLVFTAGSVEKGLESIKDNVDVDVIVLDIGLPGMTGLEGLPHIKALLPDVDIIMLTTYDDSDRIFHALCNGAQSYISKKTPLKVIMESIFTVHRGGSYMSPSIARKLITHIGTKPKENNLQHLSSRQMDIVKALSNGLSYKMIASEYGISIDTVRFHIKKIYKELEVNSKVEVVNLYRSKT